MIITDTQPHVLSNLKVDVTFQDFKQNLKTSDNNLQILEIAKKTLNKAKDIWSPKAVYQWFEFNNKSEDNFGSIISKSGDLLKFDFGYSSKFLTPARYALISVYTTGQALELESMKASSKRNLLEAYLIDLLGLIVLEKTGQVIKRIAEKQAQKSGWGVSPFMSPGSVHGWELEEQVNLCALLPLEKINVNVREDAIFSPFKTISCLIGLGPGYDMVKVGTTCQVCSKNHDCQMKHV